MNISVHRITACAVTGAAYAALTVLLAPISYGVIQFRLSEALCLLPFFIPCTAWGLFAGCVLANLFSGSVMDIVFGSLATLLAALLIARIGRGGHTPLRCFMACLVNSAVNAVIVGLIITAAYMGRSPLESPGLLGLNCLYLFLGEGGVMFFVALPLMHILPRKSFFLEFAEKINKS